MVREDGLWKCPACGYVPKEGEGDGVSCPDCHVFYHKVLQRQAQGAGSQTERSVEAANAPKKQVAMPAATTKVGRSGWFTAQMNSLAGVS